MKKIISITLISFVSLTSIVSADANKGQRIYMKKMKSSCGFSGSKFAAKHTQDEWENIKKSGKFKEEILKICPNVKVKEKYLDSVYDFSYEFASDSGNVPSC